MLATPSVTGPSLLHWALGSVVRAIALSAPVLLCHPCPLPVLQLTEGSALVLGSAGCLAVTLGHLWFQAPSLAVVLVLGLLMSGLEGFTTGLVARTLNLRVRQSLGRMFGFSLDVFSKIEAVGALGLEGRLLADYKCFARDYFR